MTCWFAVSLFIPRISNISQRGHGSKKLFPFPPGSCWWKGQKRFGSPWSWPPWICLEIRPCWKPAPGHPFPKRLRANHITKAGVPTGLPHFRGGVTLWSKIDLWWEENAFFFSSIFSFFRYKDQAIAFTASTRTHSCSQSATQNPPVQTQESKLNSSSYHSETSASKKLLFPHTPPPAPRQNALKVFKLERLHTWTYYHALFNFFSSEIFLWPKIEHFPFWGTSSIHGN